MRLVEQLGAAPFQKARAHGHIGVARAGEGGRAPVGCRRLGPAADDFHAKLDEPLPSPQQEALARAGRVGEEVDHEAGRIARRRGADDGRNEERPRRNAPEGQRLAEIVPLFGQAHGRCMVCKPAHAQQAVDEQPVERPEGALHLALEERVAEVARLVEVAIALRNAAPRGLGHGCLPCAGGRVEQEAVERAAPGEGAAVEPFPRVSLGRTHGEAALEAGIAPRASGSKKGGQQQRQQPEGGRGRGRAAHGRRLGARRPVGKPSCKAVMAARWQAGTAG